MKYFKGKIKKEHHILKEFVNFLDNISTIPEIKKIIPGRISRQQKITSLQKVSFSYFTKHGLKLKIKKGSTAQEVFITCNPDLRKNVLEKLKLYFNVK